MTAEEDSSGLAPTDAFGVLGDETRLDILRALAEHQRTARHERGLSFSELRKRVDVRDAGKFNYHLDRLRDHFVAKDEDGYYPRYAGLKVVGAILAGTYTDRGPTRSVETESTCPRCSEPLTATYEDERLTMACGDDEVFFRTALPPGAAENRTVTELVRIANRNAQQDVEQAADGVCPHCWGRMDASLPADDQPENGPLMAEYECDRCWMVFQVPAGACVVRHPAVVSLYHDHGVDVREEPFLDLGFVRSSDSAAVVSTDPTRVGVDVELAGDELELTLDGTADVVDVTRT